MCCPRLYCASSRVSVVCCGRVKIAGSWRSWIRACIPKVMASLCSMRCRPPGAQQAYVMWSASFFLELVTLVFCILKKGNEQQCRSFPSVIRWLCILAGEKEGKPPILFVGVGLAPTCWPSERGWGQAPPHKRQVKETGEGDEMAPRAGASPAPTANGGLSSLRRGGACPRPWSGSTRTSALVPLTPMGSALRPPADLLTDLPFFSGSAGGRKADPY